MKKFKRILCAIFDHKANPYKVAHDWGFPADVQCHCSRCGLEGRWTWGKDDYYLLWDVRG